MQKTGKQITINGNDTAGFDKKKVECFNCHRLGHFAKECRSPRKQDNRNTWYKQERKKEVLVEEPKAMLAIDGIGYDWSSMANEEDAPPNAALVVDEIALMASSDSEVDTIPTCTNSCPNLKNYEDIKKRFDAFREELIDALHNLANHKRCVGVLEKQILHYKKNESTFTDDLNALKRGIAFRDELLNDQSR